MTYQTIFIIILHKKSYRVISSSTGNDIVPVIFQLNINQYLGLIEILFGESNNKLIKLVNSIEPMQPCLPYILCRLLHYLILNKDLK